MSAATKSLRLTDAANAALKRAAARFPEWSEVQLANKLLLEACESALGEKPPLLPTVMYLRGQIADIVEPPPRLTLSVNEIIDLAQKAAGLRMTDDPPEYRTKAPAQGASGK